MLSPKSNCCLKYHPQAPAYLDLVPQSSDAIGVSQAPGVGVKEYDGLEASELGIVHLDLPERLDQLRHDPHANVVDNSILEKVQQETLFR